MKRGLILIAVIALAAVFAVGQAEAYPNKAACTGCHNADNAVNVTVTFQGCSGTNATYNISVSDVFDGAEGWAVFNGSSNVANGLYPSASQFTVAAGATYTVYGVSDASGGKGGSDSVTISPVCQSCTPTTELCYDGIDNDCDGAADCKDSNCAAAPECATCTPTTELCSDNIDNDCDGKIDCADRNCRGDAACSGGCTPTATKETGLCSDGIDNDCDGKIDCADRDCAKVCP